eukprot:CAMPEP_0174886074 /NCGR_PEP_ID=MMETSP0167-20121228/1337_1 /TAXON_ID=38298 /ORGANISM="Rhodella maculata, Strain CCMP736" /LENGTH=70 /DNA_ID=CAMNT_0016121921 /DNA_START=223 /DNA_END=435 /DNA_ORIENTATION=+
MSLTPKAHLGNTTAIPSTPPRVAYPSSVSPTRPSRPSASGGRISWKPADPDGPVNPSITGRSRRKTQRRV